MKKFLAILLLAAMMLTMLAACGANEGTPYTTTVGGNAGNPSSDPSGDPNTDPDDGGNAATWKKFSTTPTTEEVVLTADNGCTVTIAPVEYDDEEEGIIFAVTFDNPTDAEVGFDFCRLAINKVMLDTHCWEWIEAGETITEDVSFSYDELRMQGIFEIAVLEVEFEIDLEGEDEDVILSETIETAAAEKFSKDDEAFYNVVNLKAAQKELGYTVVDSQQVNVNLNNGVKMITKTMLDSEYGGATVAFEFVNTGDETQYVDWYITAVNGMTYDTNPDWGEILPGCSRVLYWNAHYDLSAAMKEAFGIESVASIEYYIHGGEEDVEGDYMIPGVEETLDLTATEIYNDNGLKISAKEPVQDEYGDYTYIYLIFESEKDLRVEVNSDEITVDGNAENPWCNCPYFLTVDCWEIGYVYAGNAEDSVITVPMHIFSSSYSDEEIDVWVDLELEF